VDSALAATAPGDTWLAGGVASAAGGTLERDDKKVALNQE
jgi:hypothetical protein